MSRPAALRCRLALALGAGVGACTGPTLRVDSDGPRYVDGGASTARMLPFRYYGTTVIDVLPADQQDGKPDWKRTPVRREVPVAEPIAPWLFPLDFLGEVVVRGIGGRTDAAVLVETTPAADPVVLGFRPGGLEDLRTRARAARIQR